jgi:hypothetical protein
VVDGGTFTIPEALGNKVIHPFSDFLLHDAGTGDGIIQGGPPDTANKLRTSPLWGLRTKSHYMHGREDGDVEQTGFTVPIETNKIGNHERLVFHHYGDQYFLSQVWLAEDEGHELIPGAQEKKAATNRSTGDQVVAGQ